MDGRRWYLTESERRLVIEALKSYHHELMWFCEQQHRDGLCEHAEQDRVRAYSAKALAEMFGGQINEESEHAA